ncbi:beta-N-acetylhexosaminidase [Anaerocolumna sp. MB42-C2]|uniref:beta-N-acetylhexosaminidase n=1 Tax=Anaerocolumna sp. MB42-C2 TaxID=3070997 RepID=UPI0027E13A23|nr:glycoside hydrolase family 20 zincin-like fold domain-containing protein [Anaerocolumna sp. MB42-C2]WMJ85355.1 glycoside hydrolase family 20 zincin-like fold domain-containing protein [Anaerocolumna sp. MB42-C2]
MYLIPAPNKMIVDKEDSFILKYNCRIIISQECDLQIMDYAKLLKRDVQNKLGFELSITKGERESSCIYISNNHYLQKEEYHLVITIDGINLIGGSNAGILYGIQTIRQILENKGAVLPCLTIEDRPDMPNRGFYHDATRGRIPTMEALKELADKLAYYKINQLQLYVEHSFLFKDFSEVWRDDTPLTAEDILEFDLYCRNLHIDLIPSIASFGHLYKVLSTRSYTGLCEIPDAEKMPFSFYERMAHHTLDISKEESFEFVAKMLDEYMPLFSSGYFNLCADETFDLGKGRSKELADRIGVNDMYINFVKKICDYIISKGKRPMFWGDIICGMPEYIKKLPKETICLNWGYAPDQGEKETKDLAKAGAVQYVCPGVSGWNQLINRMRDAYDNISRMCTYAYKYKTVGILNTDWGDYGHINHPEFSTAGMIYGAAFSWNKEILDFEDINRQISRIEYGDLNDQFMKIVSDISTGAVASWYEIVCFKERKQNRLNGTLWAPVLEDITWEKVMSSNESIEKNLVKFYQILSEAKQEKRYLYKAYIIAAEGIKLWNKAGAFAALGAKRTDDNDGMEARELAASLEYWYHEYKNLWRSLSRESELYRIGEVVFWYADYLRDLRQDNTKVDS